jgi:hypothetical protein
MTRAVLICGSRTWRDPVPIDAVLLELQRDVARQGDGPLVIIEGGGQGKPPWPGADKLARELAESWGLEVREFLADWDRYQRKAGPIRNQRMLAKGRPQLVVAFRCRGDSPGTDGMIGLAEAAGLPVRKVWG